MLGGGERQEAVAARDMLTLLLGPLRKWHVDYKHQRRARRRPAEDGVCRRVITRVSDTRPLRGGSRPSFSQLGRVGVPPPKQYFDPGAHLKQYNRVVFDRTYQAGRG